MSDALYGLAGALGGALITGVVAFLSPVQAQKRAVLQAREERAYARHMKRLDDRISREDLRVAQHEERRRATVARVVLIRQSVADWYDLLAHTIHDVAESDTTGINMDLGEFTSSSQGFRVAVRTALYGALEEGYRVIMEEDGSVEGIELAAAATAFASDDRQGASSAPPSPSTSGIVDVLDHATRSVRRLILSLHTDRYNTALAEAQRSLRNARRRRAELSRLLMHEVESLDDVKTIDTRGSDGSPRDPQ